MSWRRRLTLVATIAITPVAVHGLIVGGTHMPPPIVAGFAGFADFAVICFVLLCSRWSWFERLDVCFVRAMVWSLYIFLWLRGEL